MRVLTTSPLPPYELASRENLRWAAGLLVPHDGLPVADVSDAPERWELLQMLTEAIRRDIPVLAWGSGAALAGRALGAKVHAGQPEWSDLPRGAQAHKWDGERPLHWTFARVTAWAANDVPEHIQQAFLDSLPALSSRRAATPLEEIGGAAVLRVLLTDFYARARADEVLGPTFEAHVQDWDAHLEHVTAFWATMLGGSAADGGGWKGNINVSHAGLGIRRAHLSRWLELFGQAAKAHLPPEAAALLLRRAEAMALRLGKSKSKPSGTISR